MQQVQDS
ncbi:hypothetical protein VCHC50A1_2307, partial [Vibrio cholerae HC-50A1]